jgi:hypothetical protein
MLIAWLVLSGRWDVFGRPGDLTIGRFTASFVLAGLEGACELHWLLALV